MPDMKNYRSKIDEALHEGFLADFRAGAISEAELREFEADAFIEVVTEGEVVNEVDAANEVAEELISLSQSINQK